MSYYRPLHLGGLISSTLLVSLLLGACSDGLEMREGVAAYFPEGEGKYNVLVVSFDALRSDSLGTYGYSRPTSPNIDAFASRALVFENAYSSAQSTPTSFASAWTGKLPFRVFRGWNLNDTDTLAANFSAAGYKTVGYTDNQQLMTERGFAIGFDDYLLLESGDDEELMELSLRWLEDNHKQQFFGWFHFLSPHTPYEYREMATQFYHADYEGRFKKTTKGKFEVHNEEELKRVRDLYDGEIYYADSLFQQLMQQLQRLGIDKNTIVVLTSDHGEEFMDHGGIQHNTVYEEVIRIPMIIYHPAMIKAGRTDLPYSNVDLFKTLLSLVGIPTEKITDGVNLLKPVPVQRPVIITAMTSKDKRQFGMIVENHKYHLDCRPEFAERLYNLETDAGEKNDISLDHPEVLEHLFTTLELIAGGDPCEVMQAAVAGKNVASDLSEEQLERLKSLGYIQ